MPLEISGTYRLTPIVALSRAKARLVLVLSNGDLGNEHLCRIAQAIKGNGQFDDAVALEKVIKQPGFSLSAIGTVVRWGQAVGPIELRWCGKVCINDFRTGQKKIFTTSVVKERCQSREAQPDCPSTG